MTAALWALGGQGRYVWPAVGVMLALLAIEWIALGRRHRAALREAALARDDGEGGA